MRDNTRILRWGAMIALLTGTLSVFGQQPAGDAPPPPQGTAATGPAANGPAKDNPMGPRRPPMERAFRGGPPGRWWDRPELAQKLGLTPDQQKKMDDIFQQARLKLIDQRASVEKEEAILDPLISSDQPDEGRILSQIDKVAQARAELEKANARMLLGLRRVLTSGQWQTLRTMGPERRGRGFDGPGGPGGPREHRGESGESH